MSVVPTSEFFRWSVVAVLVYILFVLGPCVPAMAEDVKFSQELQSEMMGGLTVEHKGKVYTATQTGQTSALHISDDGATTSKIVVSLWSAVPIQTGSLINLPGLGTVPAGPIDEDCKKFVLLEKRTIKIEGADGFVLLPTKESIIPFWIDMSGGQLQQRCLARAAGMTWLFDKEGITFKTLTHNYTVIKKGATLEFTKNGIKLNGISAQSNSK